MLIIAMVVGTAAAQKTVGARVATLASQAGLVFGGAAFASTAGGAGDERSGVTKLPSVGTGPDATPEEMAAADKNHDGVLSTEEMADLRRGSTTNDAKDEQEENEKRLAEQQKQQQEAQALANKVAIEKKRHENVDAIINNLP